jgi:23S rRNA pseudouridine1911/1915/1917 synthase
MVEDSGNPSRSVEVVASAQNAGTRLDAFLAAAVADLSRSRAKRLIENGHVAIGGATVVEPKRPVNAGDRVRISLPPPVSATPEPEAMALDIVYEDEDVIVIDKPAGIVVHPAPGHSTGTLVNALIAHCGPSLSGIGGVRRPGIVHRLDKDTTGLLVAAKNDRAHRGLAEQFAAHGADGDLEREYRALVWGVPAARAGAIDAEIGRSPKNRQKMAVSPGRGRRAVTHYRVAETFGPAPAPVASLLTLRLETGRTHQIRVHLARLGHALIGDQTYGGGMATRAAKLPEPARSLVRAFPRQALHAAILGFRHPGNGQKLRFVSELPPDMAELVAALRQIGASPVTLC